MSPTISRTFDPRYLLEGVPKRDLSNLFSAFERFHSRKLMNETPTVKITRRPPRQCNESALNRGGLRAIVTMQTNIQPGSPRANGKENNQSGPNQIITLRSCLLCTPLHLYIFYCICTLYCTTVFLHCTVLYLVITLRV